MIEFTTKTEKSVKLVRLNTLWIFGIPFTETSLWKWDHQGHGHGLSEGHDLHSSTALKLVTEWRATQGPPVWDMTSSFPPQMETILPSGVEAEVCADISRRQQVGTTKYGRTVAEAPLDLKQWLQHAYEECLDQAIYLKRAMREIDEIKRLENKV